MRCPIRTRMAHALGRHLVRIMPVSRRDWALGMQAEIEAIDEPGPAVEFALGCIQVGYRRKLQTVSGVLAATRWGVATVTLLFAALALANAQAALVQGSPNPLSQIFGGLGLAFLIAGLTLALSGPRTLIMVAATMLALNTIALLLTGQTIPVHAEIYRALIVEGYLLWSILLMAGLALHFAPRSPGLLAVARTRGWEA